MSDANDGAVFTTPARARYVDALYDALDSKTCGEFRSRIPGEEWKELQEDLPALLAELERRGISAVHAPDLQFN